MENSKRPPRQAAAAKSDAQRPESSSASAEPQAPIRVPHNAFIAIEISKSRDGNRIAIDILLMQQGRWLLGGVSPTFPANLLDSVISGLQQLRDRQAGGR